MAPVLLIVVCVIRAAGHATALNIAGLLVGIIWWVLALNNKFKSEPRGDDGLTPTMARALKRALEKQKTDPLIKLQIGGKEIFDRMVGGLKDERGVHIESLLALLGALAGYACQFSVREQNTKSGAKSPVSGLAIATGADGRKYYFGDALNKSLAEDRYSVWSLTAGTVEQLGKPLPDLTDIFKHVAATVGSAQFGIPRLPEGHGTGDLPINYLKAIWPKILPVAWRFCDEPAHLPMVFGLAIQNAILMAKDVIDPTLAGTIAMECAVPMSKVDLG